MSGVLFLKIIAGIIVAGIFMQVVLDTHIKDHKRKKPSLLFPALVWVAMMSILIMADNAGDNMFPLAIGIILGYILLTNPWSFVRQRGSN